MKIKPHYAPIEILLAEPPPHLTQQARLLGSRAFHITVPVSAHLLPPLCSLPCFQHLPASCCSSNIPKPCPASGPLHGLQSQMERSAPECLPGYSTYIHSGLNSSITSEWPSLTTNLDPFRAYLIPFALLLASSWPRGFLKINFYWNIVDLYCVSFCSIAK